MIEVISKKIIAVKNNNTGNAQQFQKNFISPISFS